jgi:hypothetical protein
VKRFLFEKNSELTLVLAFYSTDHK